MPFKRCPCCGVEWLRRAAFLADPDVSLTGYQANFKELEVGLLLFDHRVAGCGTTMAVWASEFTDLYRGPMFEKRLRGTPSCPGYCLRHEALDPCPNACECAYIRSVLEKIRQWPKKSSASKSQMMRRRREDCMAHRSVRGVDRDSLGPCGRSVLRGGGGYGCHKSPERVVGALYGAAGSLSLCRSTRGHG